MKFYYNGKLMRTSKRHDYKFAVVDTKTTGCIACSGTEQGAQGVIRTKLNNIDKEMTNCRTALRAIEAGRTSCNMKFMGRTYKRTFTAKENAEYFTRCIAELEQSRTYYEENWTVVPLEAREK